MDRYLARASQTSNLLLDSVMVSRLHARTPQWHSPDSPSGWRLAGAHSVAIKSAHPTALRTIGLSGAASSRRGSLCCCIPASTQCPSVTRGPMAGKWSLPTLQSRSRRSKHVFAPHRGSLIYPGQATDACWRAPGFEGWMHVRSMCPLRLSGYVSQRWVDVCTCVHI